MDVIVTVYVIREKTTGRFVARQSSGSCIVNSLVGAHEFQNRDTAYKALAGWNEWIIKGGFEVAKVKKTLELLQ